MELWKGEQMVALLDKVESEIARLQRLRDELKNQLAEAGESSEDTGQPSAGRLSVGPVTVLDLKGMGLKDAIRLIARQNGREFTPQQARPLLVAAALLKQGKDGSNELNKLLAEMPEMTHKKRNLWLLTEATPTAGQLPANGTARLAQFTAAPTVGTQPKPMFVHNGFKIYETQEPGSVPMQFRMTDGTIRTLYREAGQTGVSAAATAN